MKRILVVEDNKFEREGIVGVLESHDFKVDAVENGLYGFEKIQETVYDMVITDLMMPLADGIQFLHRLRTSGNDVPVVVVTAYENVGNMLSAYELGAVDILEKPYDIRDLIALINTVTGDGSD